MPDPYPIGSPGKPWGPPERLEWRKRCDKLLLGPKRSYEDEVLAQLEPLDHIFTVTQYGALPIDKEKYPLFAAKTRDWDPKKPAVLVTGGVHGASVPRNDRCTACPYYRHHTRRL